jgi:hypothetical protein
MTDYISIDQARELHGLTHRQLYAAAEQGTIRTQVRGSTRYHKADVQAVARSIKQADAARVQPSVSAEDARAALSVRQRLDAVLAKRGRRASGGVL